MSRPPSLPPFKSAVVPAWMTAIMSRTTRALEDLSTPPMQPGDEWGESEALKGAFGLGHGEPVVDGLDNGFDGLDGGGRSPPRPLMSTPPQPSPFEFRRRGSECNRVVAAADSRGAIHSDAATAEPTASLFSAMAASRRPSATVNAAPRLTQSPPPPSAPIGRSPLVSALVPHNPTSDLPATAVNRPCTTPPAVTADVHSALASFLHTVPPTSSLPDRRSPSTSKLADAVDAAVLDSLKAEVEWLRSEQRSSQSELELKAARISNLIKEGQTMTYTIEQLVQTCEELRVVSTRLSREKSHVEGEFTALGRREATIKDAAEKLALVYAEVCQRYDATDHALREAAAQLECQKSEIGALDAERRSLSARLNALQEENAHLRAGTEQAVITELSSMMIRGSELERTEQCERLTLASRCDSLLLNAEKCLLRARLADMTQSQDRQSMDYNRRIDELERTNHTMAVFASPGRQAAADEERQRLRDNAHGALERVALLEDRLTIAAQSRDRLEAASFDLFCLAEARGMLLAEARERLTLVDDHYVSLAMETGGGWPDVASLFPFGSGVGMSGVSTEASAASPSDPDDRQQRQHSLASWCHAVLAASEVNRRYVQDCEVRIDGLSKQLGRSTPYRPSDHATQTTGRVPYYVASATQTGAMSPAVTSTTQTDTAAVKSAGCDCLDAEWLLTEVAQQRSLKRDVEDARGAMLMWQRQCQDLEQIVYAAEMQRQAAVTALRESQLRHAAELHHAEVTLTADIRRLEVERRELCHANATLQEGLAECSQGVEALAEQMREQKVAMDEQAARSTPPEAVAQITSAFEAERRMRKAAEKSVQLTRRELEMTQQQLILREERHARSSIEHERELYAITRALPTK
mgnify:FL=1